MVIDDALARVLTLSPEVSELDLATRLAERAEANTPANPESIRNWVEFASAVEALLNSASRAMDDAEAAHYIVSDTELRTADSWDHWVEAFAKEGEEREADANPDTRLRQFLMLQLLPELAAAGRIALK